MINFISKILFLIVFLFIFSCSGEKKLVKKPIKKLEKIESSYYLPQFSSLVIKNNKLNRKIFNKDYSPSVIYEFEINKSIHFLFNDSHIANKNSLKLNYYYLSPVTFYELGYFKYNIDEFDFYFQRNLFRVISLNKDEMTLFSTGYDDFKGEIPKEINIFNTNKIDIVVHEQNPLFYDYFIDIIDFKYKFKTIKSYFLIKYLREIEKKEFYKEVLETSYVLVVTLSDFEEITSFKKLISKTYIHHIVNFKDVYSSKNKKIYIFFNGDKIIFSKNINTLNLLNKLNKIPLTNINEMNKNNGYVITRNKKYLEAVFKIFKKINFDNKIIYYFFDYKKE